MPEPKIIVDRVCSERYKRATWEFCGAFPLKEIARGRRACREGWRDRGDDDMDMLAVCQSIDLKDHTSYLFLQRESADAFEDGGGEISIEDMLAEDWYLEVD